MTKHYARQTQQAKGNHTDIPGCIYLNGRRWWWDVRLPGEETAKPRPLKPDGAKFATADRYVAEEIARQWWRRATFNPSTNAGGSIGGQGGAGGGGQLTVTGLVARYTAELQRKFPPPSDQSLAGIRALCRLVDHCPNKAVEDFSPADLKAVRATMISDRLSRSTINRHVRVLLAMFRWGVEEGLVYQGTAYALECVKTLSRGEYGVKEARKIIAVPRRTVERTLPHLPPTIADMVQLQWLTGMRSGEICQMRPCDIDAGGNEWYYRPQHHKTSRFDKERLIGLGPLCQELLKPYLAGRAATSPIFSPQESETKRRGQRTAQRQTPPTHGNTVGSNRVALPRRQPGRQYSSGTYGRRVAEAIAKANRLITQRAKQEGRKLKETDLVPVWHPHQLRHAYGKRARAALGLDAVRAQLGHESYEMSNHYAEVEQLKLVRKAARKLG